MSKFELHSSDEFFEECNEIINQELEHFDIKMEYNEIIISRDKLMDICRHFYLYGDFIKEDFKHPEDKEYE
jgi:hypothetical protein